MTDNSSFTFSNFCNLLSVSFVVSLPFICSTWTNYSQISFYNFNYYKLYKFHCTQYFLFSILLSAKYFKLLIKLTFKYFYSIGFSNTFVYFYINYLLYNLCILIQWKYFWNVFQPLVCSVFIHLPLWEGRRSSPISIMQPSCCLW